MKPRQPFLPVLGLFVLVSQPVLADGFADFDKAAASACDKMKSCLRTEMKNESAQHLQMAEQMLGAVCLQLQAPKQYAQAAGFGSNHPVITDSTACLNSMANKSCNDLETETPECAKASQTAEKYAHQMQKAQ